MGTVKDSNRERKRSRSRDDKKRKKKKSRQRSSSLSSASSDDSDAKFDRRLHEERKRAKKLRKAEKQKRKEMETPEDKRARRLAKKLKKQEARAKTDESYLPPTISYTNMNNPFNDSKLTDTFVWAKKLEVEGRSNLSKKDIEKETRDRVHKNLNEMEELKRNRDARLAAKEDYEMIKRDKEKQEYGDWDQKEAAFLLNQAKDRSKLRIQQNRAKPIDLLIRYVSFSEKKSDLKEQEADAEFELVDPLKYVKGLDRQGYEDLFEDIKVARQFDGDKNVEFWTDISTVAEDENKKLSELSSRDGVADSVKDEFEKVWKGKSISELIHLDRQIQGKIRNAGAGTDIGYWQALLRHLAVYVAKARIRKIHRCMLDLKLKRIREEQMRDSEIETNWNNIPKAQRQRDEEEEEKQAMVAVKRDSPDPDEPSGSENRSRPKVNVDALEDPELDEQEKEAKWRLLKPDELEEATLMLYDKECYSPTYGDPDDTMPGIEVLEESEDAEKLQSRRAQNKKAPEGMTVSEAAMMAMARKGMDGDESTFSVEIPVEAQTHLWSDKYRPRKPRYLNRVQTGFEWNKYNQTHYDMDNPPPKIVQGYKFNVFYPDLLDVTETPSFQVFPDADPDFATIRFHAGPPYEDIAFKIVNREWDVIHKAGYKCQFQGGVFQLWFMFKKYRYRR